MGLQRSAATAPGQQPASSPKHTAMVVFTPTLSLPLTPPSSAFPADYDASELLFRCFTATRHPDPTPPAPLFRDALNWKSYVQALPDWVRSIMQDKELIDTRHFDALLSSSTRFRCSDGGEHLYCGSFGAIFGDRNFLFSKTKGYAHGTPMQSHRSECYGHMSLHLILLHYLEFLDIGSGSRVLLCANNKEMVGKSQSGSPWISPKLRLGCNPANKNTHQRHQTPPSKSRFIRWIKCHEDHKKPFNKLSRPAQFICIADNLATMALDQLLLLPSDPTFSTKRYPPTFPRKGHHASLSSQILDANLRWHISSSDLHSSVGWVAFCLTKEKLMPNICTFHTKLASNSVNTNHQAPYHGGTLTNCPRYLEPGETTSHIFQCPSCRPLMTKLLQRLNDYLRKLDTAAHIPETLLHGLSLWLGLPSTRKIPPTIQYAFDLQSHLCWHLYFRGLASNRWALLQDRFLPPQPLNKRP